MTLRTACAALFLLSGALLWLGCDDSRSCDADDDCFSGEVCIDQICAPDSNGGGSDGGESDAEMDAAGEDAASDTSDTNDEGDALDDAGDDADTSTGEPRVIEAETGDRITCALFDNGEVYCWGYNENGLLNIDSVERETAFPSMVNDLPAAKDLELGDNFACIMSEADQIYCWGENRGFVAGEDDQKINPPTPYEIDALDFVDFRAGALGGCALVAGRDRLVCWGEAPNPPDFNQEIIDFEVGSFHACAVVADGNVRCWGSDFAKQVGEDDPIRGISNVEQLDAAASYNCAIKTDGTVWCWGENTYGNLGQLSDNQPSTEIPEQVPGIDNATHVSTGDKFACAILEGGSVECWGQFKESDGAYTEQHEPMEIYPLIAGVEAVDIGDETGCALKADGEVWCWGDNNYQQLGNRDANITVSGEPYRVQFE